MNLTATAHDPHSRGAIAHASQRCFLVLIVLLVISAGLRLYGSDWGLPEYYHPDENKIVEGAFRLLPSEYGDLSPLDVVYPPLMRLSVRAAVEACRLFGHVDRPTVYVIARVLSAAFGILTVWLVYRIGAVAYGRSVGLWAAAFLTFTVLHLRDSHFATVDVLLGCELAAMTLVSLRILADGRSRDYVIAGVLLGLSVCTKYTALVFCVPIGAAWLLRIFVTRGARKSEWRSVMTAATVAAGTFIATNPYFIVAPREHWQIAVYHLENVTRMRVDEWALHFEKTTPYLYYFQHILPFAMGIPLLLLGIAGMIRGTLSRRPADLLLLAFPVIYFLVTGGAYHKFIRYALPLVPFFCLFAARAIEVTPTGGLRRVLANVAGTMVLVLTAGYAIAYMDIYRRPDSRNATADWVHEHVPAGATVLIEWDKVINAPIDFDRYNRPVARLDRYEEVPATFDEHGPAAVRQLLESADYIIFTERHAFRYMRLPERFPEAARFYRDLLAEKFGYEIVFHAAPYPRLFGMDIRDEGAEQTFREFDHPHVWVLQYRGPTASADSAPAAPVAVEGAPTNR